jgi:hypothetical protein
VPVHAYLNRDGSEPAELEEFDEYIVVNGTQVSGTELHHEDKTQRQQTGTQVPHKWRCLAYCRRCAWLMPLLLACHGSPQPSPHSP